MVKVHTPMLVQKRNLESIKKGVWREIFDFLQVFYETVGRISVCLLYTLKWTFWKKSFYKCIKQPKSFKTKYGKTLCLKILLFYRWCLWHRWLPFHLNIFENFHKNSKRPQKGIQGQGGNWFVKETESYKSRVRLSFRKRSHTNPEFTHRDMLMYLFSTLYMRINTMI